MESNRCNFEQSKALKALGYNVPVHNWFDVEGKAFVSDNGTTHANDRHNHISRPTIQDAIRFFRVEKGIHGWVESNWYVEGFQFLFSIGTSFYPWKQTFEGFKSHDSAENALLNGLIEISGKANVFGLGEVAEPKAK